MQAYLICTSQLTSEEVPEKYLKRAQKEECVYWEYIPNSYLSNPEKYGWSPEVPERFNNSIDILTEEAVNSQGQKVQWVKFSYPGVRHFVEINSMEEMESLISEFGGNVHFHKRGQENSSRLHSPPDVDSLLGSPDIGESIILEIYDDKLDEILFEGEG